MAQHLKTANGVAGQRHNRCGAHRRQHWKWKDNYLFNKEFDSLHDPNFIGVIARESVPQLVRPGGIISESKQIYPHFGGVYKSQAKTWVFPSGAQIVFAGIPDEAALPEWQGNRYADFWWMKLLSGI